MASLSRQSQHPWQSTVIELSALMARKALSPVELLELYLARIERINPVLNAIVALDIDGARAAAQASEHRMMSGTRLGVLDGIPATIKDNLFAKGLPATWGSRLFDGFMPADDDRVVANLRAAGAVIVGKTNTPELALAAHTDNLLFGKTRNPWDTALTPGGSSGGAVAAIAAGLAPIAIGTDAGGSIRRPAGYTGIVGLRPSTGRIPRRHGFPALANDFQVIGPAARTVAELYEVFRTVACPEAADRASLAFGDRPLPQSLESRSLRRLRIRYVSGIGSEPVDPQVRAAIAQAAQQVAALGHEVVEGPVPFDIDQVDAIRGVLSGAAVARVVEKHADWREKVGEAILDWGTKGLRLTATDYVNALDSLQALRVRATAEFETFDILLTATSTAMPWPVEYPLPKEIDGRTAAARGSGLFSGYVNAAGLPAISVPVDPSPAGLPIGMQLVGAFGEDLTVLQLARQFEEAHPWAARWPALATADA
ncbi:MAG: amidase [Rhodocyclaceae bacterium]|nr:amidase [Rhodocyclaceae bacterium]